MLRSAALALALTVLSAQVAAAFPITGDPIIGDPTEVDLATGYPLSNLGIEVSAVEPAEITTIASRDVLALPVVGGELTPGGFTLSHLGGLQLARGGATATITNIEMMGLIPIGERPTIAGTAKLALDGLDQGVIQLDLAYCDQRVFGLGACLDDDGSSILTGVRIGLKFADAVSVFQHLGIDNAVVPQLGIARIDIRIQTDDAPEPNMVLLLAAVLAMLAPLRLRG